MAPTATPGPSPTPIDPALVPNCLNEKTLALGVGLKEYNTEAEAMAAMGDIMLWPDPATLPENAKFESAYFNAGDQGAFRQSTMGVTYLLGDPEKEIREVDIVYMSQIWPFEEPPQAHGTTTVRGGKTAYTFEPPFRRSLHSMQWKEDCRLVSVIADLPADHVQRIAEALRFPTPGPNNGNWGQQ
jgi:hypothetical protein